MVNPVRNFVRLPALLFGVVLLLAGCAAETIDLEPLAVDLRNKVDVQYIDILFHEPDEPDDLYLPPDEDLRDRLNAALQQRLAALDGATPVDLRLVIRKHQRMPAGDDYLRSGWYHLSAGLTVFNAETGVTLARYEIIEEYGVASVLRPFLFNTDHDAQLTNGMADAVADLLRLG